MAGGHGAGSGLNQLNDPHCLFPSDNQTFYIAEFGNPRVVKWEIGATVGQIVAGGNGPGNKNDQLNHPQDVVVDKGRNCLFICDTGNGRVVQWPLHGARSGKTIISDVACTGLAIDEQGFLYTTDWYRAEVRRWRVGETRGTLVAGGNGEGSRLNQFNKPARVFVDRNHSVYVVDRDNHRVMKWVKGAKQGIVVAGGRGRGNALSQLYLPLGLIVDQLGTVYVTDRHNDRVVRWREGATEGEIMVGGRGRGSKPNQLNDPVDLSFDRQGNLLVVDSKNHRVQKFETI